MNGITFLHTNTYKITFLTEENCISKSADNIIKYLNTLNSMHTARGSKIDIFHGYNDFNLNVFREHTRTTHSHHQEVHTNHQARKVLHHTLYVLQEIQEAGDRVPCGMHNPLKKLISTGVQHQQ